MYKMMYQLLICVTLSVGFIAGCDQSDEPQTTAPEQDQANGKVVVFAAASVTNALNEIADKFNKSTAIEVVTSYASSSDLARQIENGAEADIFISANQKWANYLAEKQLVSERKNILFNKLVIVVPVDSTLAGNNADILLADEIKSVAMGDPAAVPVGQYGQKVLTALGIWDKVSAKVAAAKDVRSALVFVETKAAEAGIVYSTDASISDKVKVIYQFPDELLKEPVSYPALTLSKAVNNENAKAFFEFLQGQQAKVIFKKYGFLTE